jgi:hypothetical protein
MFVIKLAQDPYYISRSYKTKASAEKDIASNNKLYAKLQGYYKTSMGERVQVSDLKWSVEKK